MSLDNRKTKYSHTPNPHALTRICIHTYAYTQTHTHVTFQAREEIVIWFHSCFHGIDLSWLLKRQHLHKWAAEGLSLWVWLCASMCWLVCVCDCARDAHVCKIMTTGVCAERGSLDDKNTPDLALKGTTAFQFQVTCLIATLWLIFIKYKNATLVKDQKTSSITRQAWPPDCLGSSKPPSKHRQC